MKKIVIVTIIVLLAAAFIIFGLAELKQILEVLKKSNPLFLLVALFFEIACLCNNALTFGSLYRLVGLKEKRRQLFLLTTAANFINLIAPSGGVGGIAVFIDAARRRNVSTARVMVVGVLYLVYEYAALFCILLLGFLVLIRRNNLNAGELVAASFLLVIALADGAILVLGYKAPGKLGNLLAWLARLVNRILKPFLHRDVLQIEHAYRFSREVAEGIATIRGSRTNLIWPFLFTLNNKALLLCVLASTFLALNTPLTIGTLVGGFSISYLFFYASPTPSGVGIVEGVMPAALNTLKVPITEAILITLVFRSMTIWFPFCVGAVTLRFLHSPQGASHEDGASGTKAANVKDPGLQRLKRRLQGSPQDNQH
jgi:glycosyltransferase 2 family protein